MEYLKNFNWAIIGPGNIATDFISDLRLVKEHKNTAVAVMSNKLVEAETFALNHHIRYYFDNISEMLETVRPDAVYIASPHSEHYHESLACLRKKVPVLCEKPMALNLEQAKEIVKTARQYHTFFLEGMWIRFLPSIKTVLKLLQQNIIGKVQGIVANMSYVAPIDYSNRFYNPDLGGGSLLDLGIYPVYLSLLVLGYPQYIKASAKLSKDRIDQNCTILFEFPEDVNSLLKSSIIEALDKQALIYGKKGVITILTPWNEKPAAITVSLFKGDTQNYPCTWEGRGFQFEVKEVNQCLLKGRIESNIHSHENSLILMKALDMIRKKAGITYPHE